MSTDSLVRLLERLSEDGSLLLDSEEATKQGRRKLPWGRSWVGIGLDNGNLWSSREPVEMTPHEINEVMESKLGRPCVQFDPRLILIELVT